MSRILRINPLAPDDALIRETANILKSGGVIIYPTETVYGIGALYSDEQALQRVFAIKGRDPARPVLLLLPDGSYLERLAVRVSEKARRIAERYWPGPLTLLFHAAPGLSPLLTGADNKIGCRVSSHPVAQRLLNAVGLPITSSSANTSGNNNPSNFNQIDYSLQNMVDVLIDAGDLGQGIPSTVLDVSEEPFRVVRAGAVNPKELLLLL